MISKQLGLFALLDEGDILRPLILILVMFGIACVPQSTSAAEGSRNESIVYESYVKGYSDPTIRTLDDNGRSRIVVKGVIAGVSPNGSRIAFRRSNDPMGEPTPLFVYDSDTHRVTRISKGAYGPVYWTRNTRVLCFEKDTTRTQRLVEIDVVTHVRHSVTVGRFGNLAVDIDRQSIVYSRWNGYKYDLYYLSLNTGALQRLTRNGTSDNPVVAESGVIAYSRGALYTEVWTINRNGKITTSRIGPPADNKHVWTPLAWLGTIDTRLLIEDHAGDETKNTIGILNTKTHRVKVLIKTGVNAGVRRCELSDNRRYLLISITSLKSHPNIEVYDLKKRRIVRRIPNAGNAYWDR